jgi:hypothetical protein
MSAFAYPDPGPPRTAITSELTSVLPVEAPHRASAADVSPSKQVDGPGMKGQGCEQEEHFIQVAVLVAMPSPRKPLLPNADAPEYQFGVASISVPKTWAATCDATWLREDEGHSKDAIEEEM